MLSAAKAGLSTNGATQALPVSTGPKRAPSGFSPLASLFLSFAFLQLLLLPIAAAEQHVLENDAAEPKSILGVRAELKRAEIIPTVIDDFLPTLTIDISWPSNQTADLGNTIKPDDLQKAPSIIIDDEPTSASIRNPCKSNMTYVVALTDPDAPSRDNPEWSEFCHWIVAGVPISSPGVACDNQDATSGLTEVVEYYPPGPPPKTWKHRYVFLTFKPANSTTLPLSLTKPKERKRWGTGQERHGVRQWAEENELVPVAANFIYSENKKQ